MRVWTPLTTSSSPQVMSPRPMTSTRPQSSPTCSSWIRRRSSPTKSLLRTPTTMTLHSKTCSIKYIERKSITLYEKPCLSVCRRRQCSMEQGNLLEIDRGDLVSTEVQKHRLGLVRIIMYCSAIVIVVIVHCHTAGAVLSQSAENNCPYHRVVGF